MIVRTPEEVMAVIPSGPLSYCNIVIRHLDSHRADNPHASPATTGITEMGRKRGGLLQPIFIQLLKLLKEQFGSPHFLHGGMFKLIVTADILFQPGFSHEDFGLEQVITIKAIENGMWFTKNHHRGLNWMLNEAFCHPELLREQDLAEALRAVGHFMVVGWQSTSGSCLNVGVGNEPAPSLWALKHGFLGPEEVGLRYGQALISFSHPTDYFVQDERDIKKVVKFEPEPTLLETV